MKTILIILSLFILTTQYSLLNSTLWEIKQDGTGDYTSITAGINAAVNGDTLLVHPGRYIENLNYNGKNIIITSLYGIESDERRIIRETIIDGNDEASVVVFNSGETRSAVLNGLTITNGRGEYHLGWGITGGGVFIRDSSPTISNCDINNNYASNGSAIHVWRGGNPILINNTIRYNHSLNGGAISTAGTSDLEFCDQSLNSVYMNYGGRSSEILLSGQNQSSVVIDTFTVKYPDRYFITINSRHVPDDFTFTVKHGKIDPIAADLYVSPDGCNTNSGLTAEEPLQTIALAMMMIKPDSLRQRTIFVRKGFIPAH